MTRRTILITGCSTGIGRHCALELAKKGWQVFATARKPEDLQDLESQGVRALYLDYHDTQSITGCLSAILDETGGRLDALFNNGAYAQPGAVEDLSTDLLRHQFEANFFGWHELTRQVLQVMRAQGHGRIIQCSSVLGFTTLAFRGAYTASKYALEGLTDTLRLELHDTNIQVSLIEPGPITSRFRENARVKFVENINIEGSPYVQRYRNRLAQLESELPDRFELPPQAVLDKLLHALEAKRAKPRYALTTPTHIMVVLKRLLPTAWLDKFLIANGD